MRIKNEKLQFLKQLYLTLECPEDFKPVSALYKNRMQQLVKKQRTYDTLKSNFDSNLKPEYS